MDKTGRLASTVSSKRVMEPRSGGLGKGLGLPASQVSNETRYDMIYERDIVPSIMRGIFSKVLDPC